MYELITNCWTTDGIPFDRSILIPPARAYAIAINATKAIDIPPEGLKLYDRCPKTKRKYHAQTLQAASFTHPIG